MLEKPAPTILLFACDPGGANALLPLQEGLEKAGYNLLWFGKNQAFDLFSNAGIPVEYLSVSSASAVHSNAVAHSLHQLLIATTPQIVITGTSAEDDTEKKLWEACSQQNIPSVAILDSWVNYGIRFSAFPVSRMAEFEKNPELTYQPSRVFVMDEEAKRQLCKIGIAKEKITVTGQPYFQKLRNTMTTERRRWARDYVRELLKSNCPNSVEGSKQRDILVTFASQPLSQMYDIDYLGYSEKTIFSHCLEALNEASQRLPEGSKITFLVWLHPKEVAEEETVHWFEEASHNFTSDRLSVCIGQKIITKSLTVWDLIVASDLVLGMTSMMLVETYLLSRPFLSVQIGLDRENDFVLSQRGLGESVLDSLTLVRKLSSILKDYDHFDSGHQLDSHLCQYDTAIENVLNEVKEIICSLTPTIQPPV
ncbi:MAG: hypothetical protein K2X01_03865 [Cyanobacteria bacterium]|nr:hypothetical protein [Cyanobacteriota bacterium]